MDANVESQSESEARCAPEKASKSDSVSTTNNNAFKPSKKLIRVLTVIGYVISVSLAGVMLSLYYVFLWKPTVNNVRTDARTAPGVGDASLPQALALRGDSKSLEKALVAPVTIDMDLMKEPEKARATFPVDFSMETDPNRYSNDESELPTSSTATPQWDGFRAESADATEDIDERSQVVRRFRTKRNA